MPALFLAVSKIKGRTMRTEVSCPLFFNDFRIASIAVASNAVNAPTRPTTKSVGYHRRLVR